jgi:uncharacterized protein YacL
MRLSFIKFIIALLFIGSGTLLGGKLQLPPSGSYITGALCGLLTAMVLFYSETILTRLSVKALFGGALGLLLALTCSLLITKTLQTSQIGNTGSYPYLIFAQTIFLGYLGLRVGAYFGMSINPGALGIRGGGDTRCAKILDTSVIIDGRIADMIETGFLDGPLIVPQFVLHELQNIADSADSIRRARGRRGLEILNRLQKESGLEVRIEDTDFPKIKTVDSKLVALAKETGASVVTNDYNLNKVATLQSVNVLNINNLTNALKPIVLPGEKLAVRVIKPGNQDGQGIAYLDDGTMVVIDNGYDFLDKIVDALVTTVLQTDKGRMIFAKVEEVDEQEHYFFDRKKKRR